MASLPLESRGRFPVLRLVLIYAFFGALWILLSDRLLSYFVPDLQLAEWLQTYKGWFFVAVTSVLLYLLTQRFLNQLRKSEAILQGSERRYRRIVDTASEGIWELDEHYTTTLVNRRMAEMLGYEPQEMTGRRFEEFLSEEDLADHQARVATRREGLAEHFERRLRRKDGSTVWMQVSATPILEAEHRFIGSFAMMTDITERKRAEEGLRRSNRELRAISNCNQVLLHATDEQSLLQEICRIVCEEAGYRVAWVGYAEYDEAQSVRPVASTGVEEGYLANLGITSADTEQGRGPCGTAIRTGETSCIQDYVTDPRGAPWKEVALRHGFRSAVALPLKDEQASTFGSLIIYSAQPNAFTSEEIRLLEELADDLAFGIVTLRARAARERAEQKVSLLSFALDRVRDAAFLIDEQGRCQYANESASRILGYSRAEVLGMCVADLDADFPPERWPGHWRELKERQTLTFESRHRTREGRVFPVEVSANYFEYEGRGYNLALVRDITERKRAEEERRESAERFRAIADYTYDWENWIGVDGKLLWVNPAVERITGYSVGECMAMPDFPVPIVAEADREALARQMGEAVQGSSRNDFEFRVRHKDGQLVWVAASWQPIYDSRGPRLGYRSSMRDITERKRAEEALRRGEAYLAEAQRLSHTGSWAFDVAGNRYTYTSEECVRIFELDVHQGLPTREAVSRLIHPEDWDGVNASFEKSAREKIDTSAEFRITLPSGTVKHIQVTRHPILNDAGDVVELVGTAIDMTERKQAELALQESEANLNRAQEIAHIGSWHLDIARNQLTWSNEVFRMFDLPRGTALSYGAFLARVHPEDRERVDRAWAAALQGAPYDIEHRILVGDEVKWVRERAEVEFDPQGKAVRGIGTVQDITERKQAEEEMRKTAAQWQATFDAVQDLIFLLDKDFRILRANRAAAEFLGQPFDKIVGSHCFDLIHGVSTPPSECPLAKLRQSRRHEGAEVLAREGGPWLSVSVDPLFDPSGELTQVVHVARDITERKRAEAELRRSEAYLAEGQRLSRMGSWAWSAGKAGRHYWSEEMFQIFGFEPKEGPPALERFLQRIHPEDYDEVSKDWEKTVRDKADLAADFRTVLPDGAVRDIHIIGHPVLDDTGNLIEYVGTAVDVTERKRTEDELRTHREHLEELVKQRTEELALLNQLVYGSLEAADVGAWWIDLQEPDTCHALDNTVRMLGLEPDPTGEKTYRLSDWHKLLADTAAAFPEYALFIEEMRERFAGAVSGKYDNYRSVYPLGMPDGSLKWIDARAEVAKRDEGGQAQLMTGTLIDVTKLKQAEADLTEAKARAEAANREKSAFLANMSHELRTPLNAVLGFSRLLKRGPDVTPRQQETLDIIVRSGEHLLNLINNVLDMAKIESGRVVLEESEVDLQQLLHEMQSLMGVGAAEKGLHFALESAADLPRFVAVDAGKLRQVLLNLVGNAIKYTDCGGVTLRAAVVGRNGAETAQVRFEVEDSGPGIRPEDCQRIFFPFVQVGEPIPARAGTGLGLAICKQYVELMGGQIGVASEPGKGSAFYFHLPVRILPATVEPEEPKHGRVVGLAAGQPRCRLLIAEDQPENRLLLRRLLDPLGFELREAANGQEAVALFEQWQPDLIWMDIRMPVMDGMEAVRRIRATPAGAATKIIALTAHALEEERGPILAVGCDDLVRKPFREQELFDALARHLRLRFLYEKTPRAETPREEPGLTLCAEQLDTLPAELRQELRQAVIELDTARTQALIEQVAERDAALGRALNTLATRLDYPSLLKWLGQGHSQTGEAS